MSTKFTEDCTAILNVVMPKAEARAKLAGRVLAALERSEVAHLVRESLRGNHEALESLQLYTGTPASPAKPAAPAVNEETDLGRALLAGRHWSPFFETAPRSAAQITESAGNFSPETAKLSDQLPAFKRDEIFGQAMLDFAQTVPFGARRLDD
jgi:hypothetical protein